MVETTKEGSGLGVDQADQVKAIVSESMEAAFEKIIPEVPFAVEIRVADSWKLLDLKHTSLLLRESLYAMAH